LLGLDLEIEEEEESAVENNQNVFGNKPISSFIAFCNLLPPFLFFSFVFSTLFPK